MSNTTDQQVFNFVIYAMANSEYLSSIKRNHGYSWLVDSLIGEIIGVFGRDIFTETSLRSIINKALIEYEEAA